jgi:hypothetical protein
VRKGAWSPLSISINSLARQLSVSPAVVKTLIDHSCASADDIYAENGELTDSIAADLRIQLNLGCERRIPELYLG